MECYKKCGTCIHQKWCFHFGNPSYCLFVQSDAYSTYNTGGKNKKINIPEERTLWLERLATFNEEHVN